MRLIDADALKKYVNDHSTSWLNEWDTAGVFLAIEKTPTVDTKEVKHAYWRDCFQDSYLCSHCKYTVPKVDYGHKYPYCPHCGAKMDVEG